LEVEVITGVSLIPPAIAVPNRAATVTLGLPTVVWPSEIHCRSERSGLVVSQITSFGNGTVSESVSYARELFIASVPLGSALLGTRISLAAGAAVHWQFEPDQNGLYELHLEPRQGTDPLTVSVDVCSRFAHDVTIERTWTPPGLTDPVTAIEMKARLLVLVAGDYVVAASEETVGEVSPRLDATSGLAALMAAQAPAVQAALGALVGRSATWVATSGLEAVQTAFRAAWVDLPEVPSQNQGDDELLEAGWTEVP
jgi:hypothetical protein